MFSFFPQIIILLSLGGIIVIIARKIPALAEVEKREQGRAPLLRSLLKKRKKIWGLNIKNFCLFVFKRIIGQLVRLKKVILETGKAPLVVQEQLKHLVLKKPSPIQTKEPKVQEVLVTPVALLNKADVLFKENKLNEAEKIYIEVIKKDPKNIKAYLSLGKIYLKWHNFGDAKASFRQVIKLNPKDEEAQLQLKKLDEATEEAKEKIKEK